MPTVERCLCCGLHQGAVIGGNYAIMVYGAAMGLTLWWIIDEEGNVPIPGYIIACLYFITFIASVVLVLSLSVQKKTSVVLLWLLVMSMFLLPECGLNMWICIFILGTNTGMGLGFLIFYVARAVINILCMICIHALYCIWKDEKITRKQKITQMYWRSLYGNQVPPFLMWNSPGGVPPNGYGPPGNNMLPMIQNGTCIGQQQPMTMVKGQPQAPPRKRSKLVNAGEIISYQVEEPMSILGGTRLMTDNGIFMMDDDSPPSRDSAISSEHSSASPQNGSKQGAPSVIYDPIRYMPLPGYPGLPPSAVPPGGLPQPGFMRPLAPLALPWTTMGPQAPQPPRRTSKMGSYTLPPRLPPPGAPVPRFRFHGPPAAPPRPVFMGPMAPYRQPTYPSNRSMPKYGTIESGRTTRSQTGNKIYEVVQVPKHNPVPHGSVFDIDQQTEPGFENFLLQKTLSEQIHTYKPKSLHGDDTGYYSRHRTEPDKHVVKRNPIGHQDYFPPLDPHHKCGPGMHMSQTLGSPYRGLRRTHFVPKEQQHATTRIRL